MNYILLHQRLTFLVWLCFLPAASLLCLYFEGLVPLTTVQFTVLFSVLCGILLIAPRYMWFKASHLKMMFAIATLVMYWAANFYGWPVFMSIIAVLATFFVGIITAMVCMFTSPHQKVFAIAVHKARLKEQHIWQHITHHLPCDPIPMWEYVYALEEQVKDVHLKGKIITLCTLIVQLGLDKEPRNSLLLNNKQMKSLMDNINSINAQLAKCDKL